MPTSCTGDADGRAVEARAGRAVVEVERRAVGQRPARALALVEVERRPAGDGHAVIRL